MTEKTLRSYRVDIAFNSELEHPTIIQMIGYADTTSLVRPTTIVLERPTWPPNRHLLSFHTNHTERSASEIRQIIRNLAGTFLVGGVEIKEDELSPVDSDKSEGNVATADEPTTKETGDLLRAAADRLEEDRELKEDLSGVKRYKAPRHQIALTEKAMMQALLQIFPLAEQGEDNDGQLVIYTGCKFLQVIVPMDED